jgi:hypothetical protein
VALLDAFCIKNITNFTNYATRFLILLIKFKAISSFEDLFFSSEVSWEELESNDVIMLKYEQLKSKAVEYSPF